MYSIGQVAEMFGMPISTLRYYDARNCLKRRRRIWRMRSHG